MGIPKIRTLTKSLVRKGTFFLSLSPWTSVIVGFTIAIEDQRSFEEKAGRWAGARGWGAGLGRGAGE